MYTERLLGQSFQMVATTTPQPKGYYFRATDEETGTGGDFILQKLRGAACGLPLGWRVS